MHDSNSSVPLPNGKNSEMAKFDCLERPLSIFFYRYGRYVSRHPMPFLLLPILFTLAMAIGFLHMDEVTDAIYLFTPRQAASKMERQTIHDLWPLHDNNYIPGRAVTQSREIQVIALSRDDANILETEYAEAVYRLDMFIQNRIQVVYENRTYGYTDLCLQWHHQGCPGNKHISIISDLFNHGINITFPTFRVGSRGGYIGGTLGGVSLSHGANNTNFVASAKAWLMIYHLKFFPHNTSYVSGLWEKELQHQLLQYPTDPYITFTFFHSQTLAEELKRNADSLVPRFVVAFTILIIFSMLCSFTLISGTIYVDWVLSKPTLSVLGVINAGMGVVTGIGLLNFAGMPYNQIVAVMPFLVVAVGVDNMFLMVAAFRRTNRAMSVPKRIGECMSDAAISILITAMTDAFSFGVGAITTIPAVQIFCVYTCVAILVTFIYQITFFCALLSVYANLEHSNRHCVLFVETVTPEDVKKGCASFKTRLLMQGTRSDPDIGNVKKNLQDSMATVFFRDWYAPILMQPVVRMLAAVWFLIYVAFAIYGCCQIREGLEPVNLLVADSYAIPHYGALEKYFWHYGATVQVVVNNAPDLRDPDQRRMINALVHSFANTRHTIGDESVQFWLHEVERYYESELHMSIVDSAFYGMTRHFLSARSFDTWSEDIAWDTSASDDSDVIKIKSFRFMVGMRDLSRTQDQQETTALLREVADRYRPYNVTTFMPLWLFVDQYSLVVPNTVQNIAIAMFCMMIIAVLLIPQPMCALWVAFAIASIDLGVVGYMTLWDVNLDAISMITIIMSIGFSVDYSAHITYGYVISNEVLPRDRVRMSLGALGWPLVQGAVSTILGVAVLANIPAYMIVTFFKTVFLAISIGVLHGLVFLPVMLSLFVRGCCVMGVPASPKNHQHKKKHTMNASKTMSNM